MPGNCFFNCGCGEGPPFCPITIHLVDCDGSPIEGAVVTATQCGGGGLPITPIVGETDSDGKYTLDYGDLAPTEILRYNCYTIAWDGITGGPFFGIDVTLYNCTHPINHCYRHAKVTISTTGAAVPSLVLGSRVPFTVTGLGTDTIVLTYKSIQFCAFPSPFPVTISMDVGPVDPDTLAQYLDNCTTLTVNCGDDASVSLPLFKWDDVYAMHIGQVSGSSDAAICDKGCAAVGGGPNFRGLVPKVMTVTFSPRAPNLTQGAALLGSYGGTPITVTWDGSTGWDSGCLGGPGVGCSGSPYGPFYQSARVGISLVTTPFTGFLVQLSYFGRGDCTSPAISDPGEPGVCHGVFTISGFVGCLSSPVDIVGAQAGIASFFIDFDLTITE